MICVNGPAATPGPCRSREGSFLNAGALGRDGRAARSRTHREAVQLQHVSLSASLNRLRLACAAARLQVAERLRAEVAAPLA